MASGRVGARDWVLPELGVPLADAHAHLDMLEDPEGALARAAQAGVELVVAVCELASAGAIREALPRWQEEAGRALASQQGTKLFPPAVRLTLGVHPHEARTFDALAEKRLKELLAAGYFAAVGEMGLDFHYDHSPREAQRRAFRVQLGLAHRLGLPAVIHMREAHEEVLQALREVGVPKAGCILHCFTEGPEVAEAFLALGGYLSFAGPVTFPCAEKIREAAQLVPLDRLLVETDSPYLAPVPYRGRANEPALSVLNVACIAQVKGVPASEIAKATFANARRVFGEARG